ncbi:coxsackievirus and adenovirus receptor homolog isoform X2 [Oreochromis niloticus]|uniref:coxsackievirus and adenovirus receptor homolog isoform X2 n=1 Tax=Oreochromis niloticus TaxID=8128 RepID=UPI000905738A|nr:coxsackievirus and adenovirus receptor homolog isoform X2 [Oreochromis niloticus]
MTLFYPKPITAKPGDNVILPCQAQNSNNLAGVEWSRRDLEPEYVLLLRDGHIVPEDQQPSFKDRVELQDQQMKNGDVSLILEKVTAADDGTYECRILTHGGERRKRAVETISVINLHVVPAGQTGGHTEDGGKEDGGGKIGSVESAAILSVFAVFLVAAVVGFVIYRKHKQQKIQESYQPPPEQQPV